ncbi:hypothetical protein HBK87_07865 [Streptomyces sp. 2BBP-J2]|uniref:hypothetical protein n=1 Tax=Streptomyces sp. 2BBP-J2 TaxID=2719381 RepID=UPI0014316B50|nr:hypothetical protein [Streptomyces sp. 2BBP-J2]NIL50502.1 hypothetical protein [Streptomyces sp. 2BBP-J2]
MARDKMLQGGGGVVAYLPQQAYDELPSSVRHWAVPVRTDGTFGDWTHEREWRLPMPEGEKRLKIMKDASLRAILIGDPDWRPTPISSMWVDEADGTEHAGPVTVSCREHRDLPPLWTDTEIWQWNAAAHTLVMHPTGTVA